MKVARAFWVASSEVTSAATRGDADWLTAV